ncbi:TLD family protein [Histomonas meleagridis]|uniref:TLD family protein n=1 Tax=Histomonas meleagridis TaxID=135588 RepID=UPI00355969E5|nr:TLD family protein [Histomonas meleagridis]KAH0799605.1 TLD family protein [Histomonas meleagridis]
MENPSTYVVQPGDSLQALALKFDCSVSSIKTSNHLFSDLILPGDILQIPKTVGNNSFLPITASYFNSKNNLDSSSTIPGKLLVIDEYLRFEPTNHSFRPISIHLLGHIGSVIFPCPSTLNSDNPNTFDAPDTLYVLLITYLCSIDNPDSLETKCFSATYKDLQTFHPKLQSLAASIQKQHNYQPPEIDQFSDTKPDTKPIPTPPSPPPSPPPPPHPQSPPPQQTSPSPPPQPQSLPQRPRRIPGAGPITFIGGSSTILSEDEISRIRFVLPPRFRPLNWKLLFQLTRDGSSYTSFYSSAHGAEPLIMILKDQFGDRIGAYVSKGLKMSKQYYGSGETFVFRFSSDFEYFPWRETHSNQYFVTSSDKNIAIGGGGSSAIWIDGNLLNAFSESCATFNSPSLTKQIKFKVCELEVWTLCQRKKMPNETNFFPKSL